MLHYRSMSEILSGRRPYLIGAVFVLLSAVLGLVYVLLSPGEDARLSASLTADFAPEPIRADDLYFPAEPEIIPRFIFLRGKRTTWGKAEVRPFWTDPASLDQGPVLRGAKAEIDAVFDAVP